MSEQKNQPLERKASKSRLSKQHEVEETDGHCVAGMYCNVYYGNLANSRS